MSSDNIAVVSFILEEIVERYVKAKAIMFLSTKARTVGKVVVLLRGNLLLF